jgi:beta-lactamase superfamily II metal-dependent hydrolase
MIIYIEKYYKIEGFLLADFINKEDYTLFCERIGYKNLRNDERTMLLIKNLKFYKGIIPKEGSIYEMPYELFREYKWIKEPILHSKELPENAETSNIISFRTNANYYGNSFFEKSLKSPFRTNTTRNGDSFFEKSLKPPCLRFNRLRYTERWGPCSLRRLSGNIKVRVKNVGQGNWNEIYDNNKCKVIYDIGASIFSTNFEIRKFVSGSKKAFADCPTLIISHWDIDHYQSLFEVDKSDLSNLGCVFVPDKLITETSKRAFKLLEDNCKFLNVICESSERVIKNRISLEICGKGDNFAFFRGEKSSDINKSGLALVVWNETGCVILAGDHHYSQVFCDVYDNIPLRRQINIVTPHHGGKAGKIPTEIEGKILPKLAITSTGNNNYGHPKEEIRKKLLKIGFKWLRTDIAGKDVEVIL